MLPRESPRMGRKRRRTVVREAYALPRADGVDQVWLSWLSPDQLFFGYEPLLEHCMCSGGTSTRQVFVRK